MKHYEVADIKKGERIRRKRRFRLQPVRCSRKHAKALNFGTQKTMRIAQQLYEGIDIKGQRNRSV